MSASDDPTVTSTQVTESTARTATSPTVPLAVRPVRAVGANVALVDGVCVAILERTAVRSSLSWERTKTMCGFRCCRTC